MESKKVSLKAKNRDNQIFFLACVQGKEGVVKKWVEEGWINVNTLDSYGFNALFWSIISEYFDLALWLLSRSDINISCCDPQGNTPLHKAVISNHEKLVNGLLKLGSDVNTQNQKGETVLHTAIRTNSKESILLSLLAARADIFLASKGKKSVLELVKAEGDRLGLFFNKRIQNKLVAAAVLSGSHKRLGKDSVLYQISKDRAYDPNLWRLILDFADYPLLSFKQKQAPIAIELSSSPPPQLPMSSLLTKFSFREEEKPQNSVTTDLPSEGLLTVVVQT